MVDIDAGGPVRHRDGWRLILGPPGCGKTTRTLGLVDEALADLNPADIALVTFTRAAAEEARTRAARKFGLPESAFPWFRTVHSTAFRLLGLTRDDVLGPSHAKEFRDLYGYRFSDANFRGGDGEDFRETVMGDEDDVLFAVHAWARSLRIPMDDATSAYTSQPVSPARFAEFVGRYDAFKIAVGKVDFHDMLERSLVASNAPPVDAAFIDEAQDLSPLQVALVEHWFSGCSSVTVAGDDDQAIFGWMGGDPDWLMGLSRECEKVEVLKQSYRIPRLVHGMAQDIIQRNVERVEKEYYPRTDLGEIYFSSRIESAIYIQRAEADESIFVLGRNWYLLKSFAEELRERGVPFVAEHHPHWSPIGRPKIMRAVEAAIRLGAGKAIGKLGMQSILHYVPSTFGSKGNKTRILPHGVKKKIEDHKGNAFNEKDLQALGIGHLVEKIREHGPTAILMRHVEPQLRRDVAELVTRAGGVVPLPKAVLTTVHRAKGREADTVIILPEMAPATFDAYMGGEREPERRVAYVAVTRAKHRLILCRAESNRAFNYEDSARWAIANPPPIAPPPIISVEAAQALLATHGRLGAEDVEHKAIREWYEIVSEPQMYPKLRQVAERFVELQRALGREGMRSGDARWAAYLHCRGQSE